MKVSTQKLPEAQVLLEIEVDPEQMERSLDRAYRRLVQRVEVPGFRRGKTPRPMLERHVGKGRLLEEAIDIAVPEAYNSAIEEQDIDAIGQPNIELVSAEPLSFKATVALRPTVDLGDYRSIRVPRELVAVDEADVETSLDEIRHRYAIHEPVERAVQSGDIIRADVRIEVDGRDVYKDEDMELHLREGQTVLLPGFAEGVAGAVKGEPRDVHVTMPENAESSLAGKTAIVHTVVKEVKEEKLPEPNDDFAQEVGEGFPSIAALRERLGNDIRERLESREREDYRDKALTALVETTKKLEFPPILVDREIEHFLQDSARNLGQDLDRYLEMLKRSEEDVREELRPAATERVKRSLALSELAEDEKISVEDSDVDAEIQSIIAQAAAADTEGAQRYRRIFQSPEARASLARSLLTRKTFERLEEIAGQTDGVTPHKAGAQSGEAKEEES